MNKVNTIEKKNKKEINELKDKLYASKIKRIDLIEGFIDKIKEEIDNRDLTEISTPELYKMLSNYMNLAKKELPVMELQHRVDMLNVERVTF